EERNEDTLKATVKSIYEALRVTEKYMSNRYEYIKCFLPENITFITTQELLDRYPDKSTKEREYLAAKEYGAIFLQKIGDLLSNGQKHDGRAPDYDDWELNGDIIVYYPVLDISLELSSMGIRVDETSLATQLEKAGCTERRELPFQKAILEKRLPLTIGGGIGQSRICMFFLRKCHIGEVQVSIWPEEDVENARKKGVIIL
nr:aspartate--ammonia ligase [Lachnospiraceae bacterium]